VEHVTLLGKEAGDVQQQHEVAPDETACADRESELATRFGLGQCVVNVLI
jgi:hypothetical protein